MTMRTFVREHRKEIDAVIHSIVVRHKRGYYDTIPAGPPQTRSDSERAQWVLNDEGLYLWAQSEGVNV